MADDPKAMMHRGFQSKAARPHTAAVALAGAGIVTLGLVTAPPPVSGVALPRVDVQTVQLTAVTAADISLTPVRPAANKTSADVTAADTPDFLAFAASILEYLNSLGLGAGPGLAAIGLSGVVVAFAATAYAWNTVADNVNPGLRALHIPRLPKFPVCFAGQTCAGSSAAAQVRAVKPASSVSAPAGRGVATSKRAADTKNGTTAAKVRPTKKSSAAATSSTGGSKRGR
ncbi:hypothetical protein FHT40_002770 [Mycolicibacterium sp. BK556]|uniref:hypothetical protein n=1 Tax=Mycobacteriaceae TaxID=1762 RepID=UPI0010612AE2|nr:MULTISPECIES: hypothetical protein [Mycobacteriaceae]MBB3603109.1 hypothetical protein [Mycolicibacterium sp. BK556]MBB3633304.1 hypothetical protein [Mycolicibacterium sp. BK607]